MSHTSYFSSGRTCRNRRGVTALVVLVLCAGLAGETNGQTAAPVAGQDLRYWVFFSDKASAPGKAPEVVESEYVTERARWRRAKRGSIAHSPSDAPVSSHYLTKLERAGAVIVTESRWLNAVSARIDATRIEEISALPFVTEIRPVGVSKPNHAHESIPAPQHAVPYADAGPSLTQLEVINAHLTIGRGFTGRGVILGFLDTLYDFDHPAFDRLRDENRLIEVKDFTGQEQSNYHGLWVSSVAAGYAPGSLIGPASGASILAATTEFVPTETRQEEDFFVAGLEWVERMGADVVNISLAYTTFDAGEGDYSYEDMDGQTAVTTRAVNRAASLGVAVVTSAGNYGTCQSPDNCWYYIGSPADSDSVITVGAVRPDSVRASFSSYGPTADGRIKPDVAAQGTNIVTANTQARYASSRTGTSFSSPLVAGVVAQLLEANPDLKPMEVREILRRSGHQHMAPDNTLGWGIINADLALSVALDVDVVPSPQVSRPYPSPARDLVIFPVRSERNDERISISVYDVVGRRIAMPYEGFLFPGGHEIPFSTANLAPGLYIYRIAGTNATETGTIVVVK